MNYCLHEGALNNVDRVLSVVNYWDQQMIQLMGGRHTAHRSDSPIHFPTSVVPACDVCDLSNFC